MPQQQQQLFTAVIVLIAVTISSASYLNRLSRYWKSIEERQLSGFDSDDVLIDDNAFFEGPECSGFVSCLGSANFLELGDERCRKISSLTQCYTEVKNDCSEKNLGGWQHVFDPKTNKLILPLQSLRRHSLECDPSDTLLSPLEDLNRVTPAMVSGCTKDPIADYFNMGTIEPDLVYDTPTDVDRPNLESTFRKTCLFFLSAVNRGIFDYREGKTSASKCYPVMLHRTCSILDMVSPKFVKRCQNLLGWETKATSSMEGTVTPSFFPKSCVELVKSLSVTDLDTFRKSGKRRFVGFMREDAVFPIRFGISFGRNDEAILPPEKCQLPEQGWITLLANQFYKISGFIKKNGTQGYLAEVEMKLLREPHRSSSSASTSLNRNGTTISPRVITVPLVDLSLDKKKQELLAGHGSMNIRVIDNVGMMALIQLTRSQTNCVLLRYNGLNRYHLRCRIPFDLISRSFGILVEGCAPTKRTSKPQPREDDTLLQSLRKFDRSTVIGALFELEKDSGFWSPNQMSPVSSTGQLSSSAISLTIATRTIKLPFIYFAYFIVFFLVSLR